MKLSPTSRRILLIAGAGAFVAGSLILPGLPRILPRKGLDLDNFLGEDEWEQFDERRLRQKIKNLYKAKLVRVYEIDGQLVVSITKKGKRQLLKYNFGDLSIPQQETWDKKWRLVTYDVPKENKQARDALRTTLKRLGFLQLQKSVYLYPYPCSEIVEYIREVYGVGENVTLLTIGYIENEEAYKSYFNL